MSVQKLLFYISYSVINCQCFRDCIKYYITCCYNNNSSLVSPILSLRTLILKCIFYSCCVYLVSIVTLVSFHSNSLPTPFPCKYPVYLYPSIFLVHCLVFIFSGYYAWGVFTSVLHALLSVWIYSFLPIRLPVPGFTFVIFVIKRLFVATGSYPVIFLK